MNGYSKNILNSTTALIKTVDKNGAGRGTGFMFALKLTDNEYAPLLVTNKHVLKDATSVTITLSLSSTEDYTKKIGFAEYTLSAGINHLIFEHPDEDIDLAAINIAALLQDLTDSGYAGHGTMFSERDLTSSEVLDNLGLAETIVMIGYPTGLADEKHNLPVIRQGALAGDPRIDFNGKRHFVIDCACFPGSSGSPVVLKESQTIGFENDIVTLNKRPNTLIGILYAGPIHTNQGKIVAKNIPSTMEGFTEVKHMINLGYVIPSAHITAFKDLMALRPAGNKVDFHRRTTMF